MPGAVGGASWAGAASTPSRGGVRAVSYESVRHARARPEQGSSDMR